MVKAASDLGDKNNVFFSDIVQCDGEACSVMRNTLPIADKKTFEEHWRYKFLIDADGNGASQRYKSLLYGNSLVFRHRPIYLEFFFNWIQPWKHYIPLDFTFNDIFEHVTWAMTHQEDAQKVATDSTTFIRDHLRIEDVNCYIYRLLLSYAKLLTETI